MATVPRFKFADPATKDYFQAIIDQIKNNPKTVETLQVVAPPILREGLISKYQDQLRTHPDTIWPTIIQEISLTIILNAIPYLSPEPIFSITIPSLVAAYNVLYQVDASTRSALHDREASKAVNCTPTARVSGRQLAYREAKPISGPLPRTFLISGQSGFDHGPLREMLANLGLQEETFESLARKGEHHVGCLFLEQSYTYNPKDQLRYDPRTSELTCAVKSLLPEDKRCLTNKEQLYYNLLAVDRRAAQFLAKTRKLSTVNRVHPGEVLILKPVGNTAGCGVGIRVVTTTAELHQAKSEILTTYPSGIASEYILNPLLFHGKKFHLRMYLMVRGPVQNIPPHVEIFPYGRILTAKENYVQGDFDNPAIHDSHIKSTASNYFFPQDLGGCQTIRGTPYSDADSIMDQMQQVATMLQTVLLTKMRKWTYPESNFAYEIFGCDFMIRAEDTPTGVQSQVVLLEVNDKVSNRPAFGDQIPPNWPPIEAPGLFKWDLQPYPTVAANLEEYIKFSALVWNWILRTGILPFYHAIDTAIISSTTVSPTYLISGANGINHEPLRQLLAGYTEIKVTDPPQSVGFICQEQKVIAGKIQYDKRVYRFPSFLKSLLDNRRYIITDKSSLYFRLQQLAPDLTARYLAMTRLISQIPTVDRVLIVKPVSQPGQFIGGGQDIAIVTSDSELKQVAEQLSQKYQLEPIASEYIVDPWLIDGKKAHFRMYLLIRTAGISLSGQAIPFTCQLWEVGKALTAALPYEFKDFNNPKIHDSHVKSTDRDRFFNLTDVDSTDTGLSLDQRRNIFQQMTAIMGPVGVLMSDHAFPYSDSSNAYEVFGVDFMLRRDTMTIVLLEINDHVGMQSIDCLKNPTFNPETGPWTSGYTHFSTLYWNWVYQHAIQPYLS